MRVCVFAVHWKNLVTQIMVLWRKLRKGEIVNDEGLSNHHHQNTDDTEGVPVKDKCAVLFISFTCSRFTQQKPSMYNILFILKQFG